jgi:hypothetical protein
MAYVFVLFASEINGVHDRHSMNYGSKFESTVSSAVGSGKILSEVAKAFVGRDLLQELETRDQLTDFPYYTKETGIENPV